MNHRSYHNPRAFVDLLFLCLVGFAYLFIIAYLMIMPPVDEQQKKPKAEFLITSTWDSDTDDDVDLWIQNPGGDVMFFREKEIGLMHLDHDDIGRGRDIVVVNGQRIVQNTNQEIATIRGIIPGEWIINIHMYSKRHSKPANINVRVDKLNPRFMTLTDRNYIMNARGEEITVLRFSMTGKGEVTEQDDMFKPIAASRIAAVAGGN